MENEKSVRPPSYTLPIESERYYNMIKSHTTCNSHVLTVGLAVGLLALITIGSCFYIRTQIVESQYNFMNQYNGKSNSNPIDKQSIFVDNSNNIATFYPNGRNTNSKSLVAVDYDKTLVALYVADTGCFLIGGRDGEKSEIQALKEIKKNDTPLAASEAAKEVKDMSVIPESLRVPCSTLPVYWLADVPQREASQMSRRRRAIVSCEQNCAGVNEMSLCLNQCHSFWDSNMCGTMGASGSMPSVSTGPVVGTTGSVATAGSSPMQTMTSASVGASGSLPGATSGASGASTPVATGSGTSPSGTGTGLSVTGGSGATSGGSGATSGGASGISTTPVGGASGATTGGSGATSGGSGATSVGSGATSGGSGATSGGSGATSVGSGATSGGASGASGGSTTPAGGASGATTGGAGGSSAGASTTKKP